MSNIKTVDPIVFFFIALAVMFAGLGVTMAIQAHEQGRAKIVCAQEHGTWKDKGDDSYCVFK